MRTVLMVGLLWAIDARADQYEEKDRARAAVIEALDTGDAAAFAAHIGEDFETKDIWFDNATCRKKFGTARVAAKAVPAFVKCFAGLGVRAKGVTIDYGPGVMLMARFTVTTSKTTLDSISGDAAFDRTLPKVRTESFEANRTAGELSLSFDQAARQELADAGEKGVVFDVCVDGKGRVAKTNVFPLVAKNGPTAKQVKAGVKTWQFKPFLVRGKPASVCTTKVLKL